jgi:hypothetical protein
MDNLAIDSLHDFAVPSADFKPKTGPPRRIAGKIFENLSEEAVSTQHSARNWGREQPILGNESLVFGRTRSESKNGL